MDNIVMKTIVLIKQFLFTYEKNSKTRLKNFVLSKAQRRNFNKKSDILMH